MLLRAIARLSLATAPLLAQRPLLQSPVNLNFQNPIANSSLGWYAPKGVADSGYSVEIRREGCRENPSCAAIVPPTIPKPGHFGSLFQTFNAAPYRGKTVKLHAFLKMDSADPRDGAQLFLRVDRPNHAIGAFDNGDGRPVKSVHWTPAEIVARVADDAELIHIGLLATPSGQAWIDGIAFEIVPAGTPETVSNAAAKTAPVNLDFSKGREGITPVGWTGTNTGGFSLELRRTGCRASNACAAISSAAHTFAGLAQAFRAGDYRGKTVRLRAWLKVDAAEPPTSAQLWLRVDLANKKTAFFDNMNDRPVQSADWTLAEIVGKVPADAQTVNIGALSMGKGTAFVDSLSFEVVPDGTLLTGVTSGQASEPVNLDFRLGDPGKLPYGWTAINYDGYSAESRRSGCAIGPSCAVVIANPAPDAKIFGQLLQTFSAAAYRGKTVRLRAKLKLDAVSPKDKAQLWLTAERSDHTYAFRDDMSDRPVQTSTWTDVEIVGHIDPDAATIYLGVMSLGHGQAWVDSVTFEIVPDSTTQTGPNPR